MQVAGLPPSPPPPGSWRAPCRNPQEDRERRNERANGKLHLGPRQSHAKSRHDRAELHVKDPEVRRRGRTRGRGCQSRAASSLQLCASRTRGSSSSFPSLFPPSSYFSLWRCVGLVGWVGAQRRQSGWQSGSVNAVQSGVKHTRVCDAQEQERRRSRKEERASPSSVPPPPPLSPREDGCKKMDSPGG